MDDILQSAKTTNGAQPSIQYIPEALLQGSVCGTDNGDL